GGYLMISTNALQRLRCASVASTLGFSLAGLALAAVAAPVPVQTFPTAAGPVKITPIYHATAVIKASRDTIYIDPAHPANIAGLAPAGLILITDIHRDHMDPADI